MPFNKSPSSPSPIFPTYLLPAFPFRQRKTSTDSTSSVSSITSSASEEPPSSLFGSRSGSGSYLHCGRCLADVCPTTSIISKGFTGRHGRAFLVSPPTAASLARQTCHTRDLGNLPNTSLDKAVPRQLVTGQHTVADLRCRICDTVLGWKYVAAEDEGQRYKVGKFILETQKVVKCVGWGRDLPPDDHVEASGSVAFDSGNGSTENVEFDSQDEDECEDLFAGVWSVALARKRRARKVLWQRGADVKMV